MKKKCIVKMLLCIGLLSLLLFGCGTGVAQSKAPAEENVPTSNEENSIYITLYRFEELDEQAEEAPQDEEADGEDDENDLTTVIVASVDKDDLSPATIVEQYNQLIVESVYGRQIVVNQVAQVDEQVYVDFDSASIEALQISPGSEGQLFYNLARSIDENLGDVDEIYFTMDGGKDFTLGHLWFEANRPFYEGGAPIEGEESAGSSATPE